MKRRDSESKRKSSYMRKSLKRNYRRNYWKGSLKSRRKRDKKGDSKWVEITYKSSSKKAEIKN